MKIWVIGAGGFGARAVERLLSKNPSASLMVVDTDQRSLLRCVRNAVLHHGDGVTFLYDNLKERPSTDDPDWIIPAAPVHVAFQWIMKKASQLRGIRSIPVPSSLEALTPSYVRGKGGCLYLSQADFLCPDDCPEPEERCAKTGKKRLSSLFDTLQRADIPGFFSIVIRSRQLAPGVGGYRPVDLFAAYDVVAALDEGQSAVVSTACRCHAVADALVITSTHA